METERLVLRRPIEEDAGLALWVPGEHAAALEHWREHGFGGLLALDRATGEPVAFIELHHAGPGTGGIEPGEVEIGWVVLKEQRGAGIAEEAAGAVLADAFGRLGIEEVVAHIGPENAASLRVAEKLGMRKRSDGHTTSGDPAVIVAVRACPPAAGY